MIIKLIYKIDPKVSSGKNSMLIKFKPFIMSQTLVYNELYFKILKLFRK